MWRPAGRVARNQQRRPASTALHLRTIAADFHRDTVPSARRRRATIPQVSAVMHTLMRAAAPDIAQQFARGGLFMAGRHARPARMASRELWRARWASARGVCRPMIFQGFCRFSFSDLKFKTLDTIQAIRIDQIRKTLALIPLLGIRIRPPARQRKNIE
ncbi:hypothetical protein F511_46744 [Dorcoceras hygrometricum]|uniref:Uncharacterized protein n=1 Tax=Dorcoceras hygrometricum TaxID=472368 RepID=A0A2Z6ZST0_9LAMI|nr:hypothetical protein F511_46744 [Dorcoceras hygrometricum]